MKKYYVVILLIVVLVALALFGISLKGRFAMNNLNLTDKNLVGNSNGNIVNNAFVAKQNEWVYCQDYTLFVLNRIYAFNSNNKRKVPLSNKCGDNLNIVGELLFFTRSEGFGGFTPPKLYRKNLKTNKVNVIDGIVPDKLIAYDGWIYYTNRSSEPTNCLYKARYDGSEITKLTDFSIKVFAIIDNQIYTEFNKIIILSLEGDIKRTILFEDDLIPLAKYNAMFINDDMYFVAGFQKGYGIAKINMNTGEYTQIVTGQCSRFNIQDDWIYFSKEKDLKLYKIKIDGTQEQQVGNIEVGRTGINIIDDWIYYYNEKEKLYRIKIGGSINEKL